MLFSGKISVYSTTHINECQETPTYTSWAKCRAFERGTHSNHRRSVKYPQNNSIRSVYFPVL
jgi:hypothetical protein